jgi:hypothetical protein
VHKFLTKIDVPNATQYWIKIAVSPEALTDPSQRVPEKYFAQVYSGGEVDIDFSTHALFRTRNEKEKTRKLYYILEVEGVGSSEVKGYEVEMRYEKLNIPLINELVSITNESARDDIENIFLSAQKYSIEDNDEYMAYVLATAWHESKLSPIPEGWGPTYWQKTYDSSGNALCNAVNDTPNAYYTNGEGYFFRGRGYVQLTGRCNYQFYTDHLGVDLIGNPDLALNSKYASEIILHGMVNGKYRGKSLAVYFRADGSYDFFNARSIINGDKNITYPGYGGLNVGDFIANYANNFYMILKKY